VDLFGLEGLSFLLEGEGHVRFLSQDKDLPLEVSKALLQLAVVMGHLRRLRVVLYLLLLQYLPQVSFLSLFSIELVLELGDCGF